MQYYDKNLIIVGEYEGGGVNNLQSTTLPC